MNSLVHYRMSDKLMVCLDSEMYFHGIVKDVDRMVQDIVNENLPTSFPIQWMSHQQVNMDILHDFFGIE